MRRLHVALTAILAALGLTALAGAAPTNGACAACHACESPTGRNPCLRACLRAATPPVAPASATRLPASDTILLADLEALNAPVPFNHRVHAEMAELTTGCVTCHHHTPSGHEHPACRSCHSPGSAYEAAGMPGLKGAYHRQCLSCHREWSGENGCEACHVPKRRPQTPSHEPLVAKEPGTFARPAATVAQNSTYVYATARAPQPVVTFHHGDHAGAFGLRCVECHQGDSCGRCHHGARSMAEPVAHEQTPDLKGACLTCHGESNCAFCHDQGPRPRFDHLVRAGWPLGPHHAALACSECHGAASEFTVPPKVCHACHVRSAAERQNSLTASSIGERASSDLDCLSCHEDLKARLAHAASIHGPAAGAGRCGACHQTDAFSPRPGPGARRESCLSCHDRPIHARQGRAMTNIAALLEENPNHHGPVRNGDCTACHDPHCSGHARLLIGEFTPAFYAPFALRQYELCFRCHDQKLVLDESAALVTGFRDGDRNLHKLHVNQAKGRTCRVCHEVHASCQPFHIRQSVPFADSAWTLSLNYEQSAGGGSCAPGCHGQKAYARDRKSEPME